MGAEEEEEGEEEFGEEQKLLVGSKSILPLERSRSLRKSLVRSTKSKLMQKSSEIQSVTSEVKPPPNLPLSLY